MTYFLSDYLQTHLVKTDFKKAYLRSNPFDQDQS